MDKELPTMNNMTMSCSNYAGAHFDHLYRAPQAHTISGPLSYSSAHVNLNQEQQFHKCLNLVTQKEKEKEKENLMADKFTRRIVRVFIVDTDENIPLDKCLIFRGEEQFTDATDQELFFEIDLKAVLGDHNLYRAKVLDKKQTNKLGKEIYLEPIKIRDLTMTVVNVASF